MLHPNDLLQGRYRIIEKIADGGMGAVYKATDQEFGDAIVAVKETFFTDSAMREQFKHEAVLLYKLRHPALPRVTNHFLEGSGQFLVMDYIEGPDLDRLLKKQVEQHHTPVPYAQVAAWGTSLLTVLDYLHRNGVIHRDIKPQNVKLSVQGQIVLIDFGLAKHVDSTNLNSSVHAATLGYAPPEQLFGRGTDARSDLYSLGATLYHLLTNEVPINAQVREGVTSHGAPDPQRPVDEINPAVPRVVAQVLHQAMALKREDRFASAAAMREALNQAYETSLGVERFSASVTAQSTAPASKIVAAAQPVVPDRLPTAMLDPSIYETVPMTSDAAWQNTNKTMSGKGNTAQTHFIRKRRTVLVALACALLVLLGGSFVFERYLLKKGENPKSALTGMTTANATAEKPAAPAQGVEALSYYLEVEETDGSSGRSEMDAALPTGQFRFHFVPREDGYLYIIAPSARQRLATLLTNRTTKEHAETNRADSGKEFSFPAGNHWVNVGPGDEPMRFTVIFSPKLLAEPDLLSAPAGHVLSPTEKNAFESFRTQIAAGTIESEPGSDPPTAEVLQSTLGQPVVFDVLTHRVPVTIRTGKASKTAY